MMMTSTVMTALGDPASVAAKWDEDLTSMAALSTQRWSRRPPEGTSRAMETTTTNL